MGDCDVDDSELRRFDRIGVVAESGSGRLFDDEPLAVGDPGVIGTGQVESVRIAYAAPVAAGFPTNAVRPNRKEFRLWKHTSLLMP